MTKDLETRPMSEKDADAQDQTEKFTDHENVGDAKHAETSDDITEGMPKKDRETLKKTTQTD
ncbi:hypothetical protein GGQ68_004558 [Sagittula marina]|uniref:Uncharacterized protein n=1 Tax=Sagittula marina TaxID=943940 RepID=A0A7W6GUV0_9RHOB|nr:hypothetical protein [Sagittula marina]MBB3988202.1 hypothetical protein [Sagittula marina]